MEALDKLSDFVSERAGVAVITDRGDYILVRVPNPRDFDEEELSQIAGKPVKLEALEYAVG